MRELFLSPKKPFNPTDENRMDCDGPVEIDFLQVREGYPWAPFGRMPPGIQPDQFPALIPIYMGYRTPHAMGLATWPLTIEQAEQMGKALLTAAKLTRKRSEGAG